MLRAVSGLACPFENRQASDSCKEKAFRQPQLRIQRLGNCWERLRRLAAVALLSAPVLLAAQSAPERIGAAAPQLDASITYDGTLSRNIASKNFWLQGGAVQVHGRFYRGWGAVADIAGMHTANMNSSGVGLDLVTATFGPRYTWAPRHARYELFGQGLAGVANGFNSVFPNVLGAHTTANSLAVKAGGGMNLNLKPHLALRLFEADYLRTQLPNSTNNAQNNLQLGAGLVLRFR